METNQIETKPATNCYFTTDGSTTMMTALDFGSAKMEVRLRIFFIKFFI